MNSKNLNLSDDNKIPVIGLGLWKITDKTQFDLMFKAALEAGYRHFDCAQAYENEQFLGEAWEKSGIERKEIFITTKIKIQNFSHAKTLESFEESLRKLRTDYVDLLLVHFPGPSWLRKSKWRALEEIKSAGKARSIGVSNYKIKQLKAMDRYATEKPVINQIEMHVFLQQKETKRYCDEHNIQIEAYSPLAHGQILDDQILHRIAEKHSKSYAQVMLRWCIDQGTIPLPKTVTPSRIKENISVFDFKLDDEDLAELKSLDRNLRTIWKSIMSKGA